MNDKEMQRTGLTGSGKTLLKYNKKKPLGLSAVAVIMALAFLISCTTYERKIVPFKLPESMQNAVTYNGAVIAAKSYTDVKEAREAFGFNIRSAGILPVQVAFNNKSNHPLMIVPNQTFLIDYDNNVWPILDQQLAYDRLAQKTEYIKIAPEATKKAILFGAAGAIIGAAIGIVSGHNIGGSLGKGAAIGAAAGAVVGGAQGSDVSDVHEKIKEDLQSRSLQNRAVKPHELAYGFIFFPGEVKSAKELRLQLKTADTGEISTFNLKLQ